MINPRVGLTLFTSSPIIFFTMVVFPALSSPLSKWAPAIFDNKYELPYSINIRISLSFRRAFRSIESMSKLRAINELFSHCIFSISFLARHKGINSITETITWWFIRSSYHTNLYLSREGFQKFPSRLGISCLWDLVWPMSQVWLASY